MLPFPGEMNPPLALAARGAAAADVVFAGMGEILAARRLSSLMLPDTLLAAREQDEEDEAPAAGSAAPVLTRRAAAVDAALLDLLEESRRGKPFEREKETELAESPDEDETSGEGPSAIH